MVTANIKDFIPLDTRCRAADLYHAGLILVSTKAFPQSRGFPSAVATALAALLSGIATIQSGQVLFLTRGKPLHGPLPAQPPRHIGTVTLYRW